MKKLSIIGAALLVALLASTAYTLNSCGKAYASDSNTASEVHQTLERSPYPEHNSPLSEVVFTETVTVTEYTSVKVGDRICCRMSAYCKCAECCGVETGITASGKVAQVGMVACNWLPLGSVIDIDGTRYTVADRGGSHFDIIGRVDVFCNTHQEAVDFGIQYGTLTVISLGGQ